MGERVLVKMKVDHKQKLKLEGMVKSPTSFLKGAYYGTIKIPFALNRILYPKEEMLDKESLKHIRQYSLVELPANQHFPIKRGDIIVVHTNFGVALATDHFCRALSVDILDSKDYDFFNESPIGRKILATYYAINDEDSMRFKINK